MTKSGPELQSYVGTLAIPGLRASARCGSRRRRNSPAPAFDQLLDEPAADPATLFNRIIDWRKAARQGKVSPREQQRITARLNAMRSSKEKP